MIVDAVVKFGLESRFWIIPNVLTADLFIVDRIENKYLAQQSAYIKTAVKLNKLERGAKL